MSRTNRLLLYTAVAAAVSAALALACGPFFGIEVLQSRTEVLLAPPAVSFEAELKALVPPPKDKLPVVESGHDELTRAEVEARELEPAVLANVTEMWKQRNGVSAYAAGQMLPPAIQLYTAGAVDFLRGDMESARAYFQKILVLPEQDRRSRELWAHFMLGRIAMLGEKADATAQFEATRTLVAHGMRDPLGVAVASLGEQARGAWRQGAVAKAVELYARQASYGSPSGVSSLVMIAGLILDDRNLLNRAVDDSITRRLLFVCLNNNSSRRFFVDPEPNHLAGPKVERVVAALESHGLTQVDGAGLLASAAYAQGRFDLARRFAALEDEPISAWVKAKLALRSGDKGSARREFKKALETIQPSMGGATRLTAEYAVLRVSRSDYVQALDLFYSSAANGWNLNSDDYGQFADYWGDAAYLAERVLSIDELRNYLDHGLPSTRGLTSTEQSERSRLRSVLARRLMRAGKRREALAYFDGKKVRDLAEQYDEAVTQATSWWRLPLTRAEAWFTAAKLARENGMALLGFEKGPDFAIWNGNFEYGSDSASPPQITRANLQGTVNVYESEDEHKRVAASKPEEYVRYQYRITAVDEALKSADLLPSRSQAFAAVLCKATAWVVDREPQIAEQIYHRYVHEGAHVPWARAFGRTCSQPDFAAASSSRVALRQVSRLAIHVRAHPIYSTLSAIAGVALFATLLTYLRAAQSRRLLTTNPNIDSPQT